MFYVVIYWDLVFSSRKCYITCRDDKFVITQVTNGCCSLEATTNEEVVSLQLCN